MPLEPEFSGEVARAILLAPMGYPVTLPIVGAMCAMRRVDFSRRNCTKGERNITDKIATTRDRLIMLEIALFG